MNPAIIVHQREIVSLQELILGSGCYHSHPKMFRFSGLFSRGHATPELAVSVGRSVGRSVRFLIREWFSHYRSCPTVRDWIAVYPALF